MLDEDLYKKIFSKNLRYYMELNNKNQIDIINDLGFNKSAVSTWVNGSRLPRMDKVDALAKYFNIKRSDLIEIHESESSNQPVKRQGVVIKVLGRVAAGIPIEAVEDVIDTEEITEEMARTGQFFGLQIHGDSMEPQICNGDIVIVRQQEDAESGEIIIALVNGDDACCKRLMKYAGGIGLISLNPRYDPMMFSDKDIFDKPVRIIGKVVELRRKL